MPYDFHGDLRSGLFGVNADLQAAPVVYRGVCHGSKLAAQWATFLDALRIAHIYQARSFLVGRSTRYTPDFWLPELGAWLDAQPADPLIRGAQRWKAEALAGQRPHERVWIASGAPRRSEWHIEQLGGAGPKIARAMLLVDVVAPKGRVWMCGAADEDSDCLVFDPIEKTGAAPAIGRPADPESDPVMRLAYGRVDHFSAETWTSLGMAAERRLAALSTGAPATRQHAA